MPSPFLSAVTENMRMKHYAEKTIKPTFIGSALLSITTKRNTPMNVTMMKHNLFYLI